MLGSQVLVVASDVAVLAYPGEGLRHVTSPGRALSAVIVLGGEVAVDRLVGRGSPPAGTARRVGAVQAQDRLDDPPSGPDQGLARHPGIWGDR
jgi:hypothetical protein